MCRSLSCWNGLGLNLNWKWSCHVFSWSSLFIHLLLRFKEIEPLPVCLSLSFFSLFLSLFFVSLSSTFTLSFSFTLPFFQTIVFLLFLVLGISIILFHYAIFFSLPLPLSFLFFSILSSPFLSVPLYLPHDFHIIGLLPIIGSFWIWIVWMGLYIYVFFRWYLFFKNLTYVKSI